MADVTAQVLGAVRRLGLFAQAQFAANELAEQIVANGLPPYAEMTRKGQSWATMTTSAVAGLVVRPSTTAALELFNGYPAGGKSLIIDRLFYFNLVTTAANEGWSGWAMVTTSKSAPSTASLATNSNQGNKTYAGPVINAVSTTVVANGWFPWTNQQVSNGSGVTPYGCAVATVEGRIIVPPQCSLCLHVVASLVGQTFTQGASWFEEQLTLE